MHTLSFFSVECKDERSDCQTLIDKTGGGQKLEQYCKKWKDHAAVKQCPKTCNMCEYFCKKKCKEFDGASLSPRSNLVVYLAGDFKTAVSNDQEYIVVFSSPGLDANLSQGYP